VPGSISCPHWTGEPPSPNLLRCSKGGDKRGLSGPRTCWSGRRPHRVDSPHRTITNAVVRLSHLRAWQHGSDEILSRRTNGAVVSRNGTWHFATVPIVQPEGQDPSARSRILFLRHPLSQLPIRDNPIPAAPKAIGLQMPSQPTTPRPETSTLLLVILPSICSTSSVGPTTDHQMYTSRQNPARSSNPLPHVSPASFSSRSVSAWTVVAAMYRSGRPRRCARPLSGPAPVP